MHVIEYSHAAAWPVVPRCTFTGTCIRAAQSRAQLVPKTEYGCASFVSKKMMTLDSTGEKTSKT
eukprot:782574-Amphidinium_carterae.1